MSKLKFFAILIFMLAIYNFVAPTDAAGIRLDAGIGFTSISAPVLLSPTTDNIVLNGKDELEFRWQRTDIVDTDHYELRLYKGYKTVESTLILKQNFPSATYPFKLSASQFEVGQVYTWGLIKVLRDGRKSDTSFSPFTIIKK